MLIIALTVTTSPALHFRPSVPITSTEAVPPPAQYLEGTQHCPNGPWEVRWGSALVLMLGVPGPWLGVLSPLLSVLGTSVVPRSVAGCLWVIALCARAIAGCFWVIARCSGLWPGVPAPCPGVITGTQVRGRLSPCPCPVPSLLPSSGAAGPGPPAALRASPGGGPGWSRPRPLALPQRREFAS